MKEIPTTPRHLQSLLKAGGYYSGKIDGIIGPVTMAGIERWLATLQEPTAETIRKINDRGIELIKHFEGLFLTAYKDPVGIYTIGFGHTGLTHRDGTVKAGRTITRAEAEKLLRHDMNVFEKRVAELVTVPLNDDQFAALVSFDFNTGGLAKSTLLKRLNAGHYDSAADQFLAWNKGTINGKRVVLAGLTRRRKSEKRLFEGHPDPIIQA